MSSSYLIQSNSEEQVMSFSEIFLWISPDKSSPELWITLEKSTFCEFLSVSYLSSFPGLFIFNIRIMIRRILPQFLHHLIIQRHWYFHCHWRYWIAISLIMSDLCTDYWRKNLICPESQGTTCSPLTRLIIPCHNKSYTKTIWIWLKQCQGRPLRP